MLIDHSYVFKYFEKKMWKIIFSEFFFVSLNNGGYIFPIFKNLGEQILENVKFFVKKL